MAVCWRFTAEANPVLQVAVAYIGMQCNNPPTAKTELHHSQSLLPPAQNEIQKTPIQTAQTTHPAFLE